MLCVFLDWNKKSWVFVNDQCCLAVKRLNVSSDLYESPEGKPGMSDVCPLESQGYYLIPSSCLLFFYLVLVIFLPCSFSAKGPFS